MGLYGAADWASENDLANAGLLSPSADTPLLGYSWEGRWWLYDHGDGHLLTVAPPGTGKTVFLVVPNLLHYQGSVIVTAPKGELVAMTARHRKEAFGHRIVTLNPWREEMTEALGLDLGDTGFNPLYLLQDNASLHDNAKMIGELICPTPPNINDPEWSNVARALLVGCLKLMVRDPSRPVTLSHLATMVRDGVEGWHALAEEMDAHGLPDHAGVIRSKLISPRQFAGYLSRMHDATEPYLEGSPLGEHCARDQFDPADLKREKVTVYIVIPSNRRDANKTWLSLVLALMAEAVGRPGPAKPVLLLAEEFANLGYMPTITRAMAEYREAGLKVWLIVQTLDQLRRLYGVDGAQEIANICGTHQFFGTTNYDTARRISEMTGQRTVQSESQGVSVSGALGQNASSSTNTSETGVPLIRPEEVLNMRAEYFIMFRAGPVPPIRGRFLAYYEHPDFYEFADVNPYRGTKGPNPWDIQRERRAALARIEAQKPYGLPVFFVMFFFGLGLIALAQNMFNVGNDVEWLLIGLLVFVSVLAANVPRRYFGGGPDV
jgi:type IV secretion system protein VirD4